MMIANHKTPAVRIGAAMLMGAALTLAAGSLQAGAYVFAGAVNGVNIVTHPKGYTGTSQELVLNVCIAPGTANANDMEISVQNVVSTYNALQPTTGNLLFGANTNIPSGKVDFESTVLHEMGHCLGLAHPNAATESGLPGDDKNYTKATKGSDGVYNLNAGADGIRGSSDDVRGDDVNLHWFRISNNNPFTIADTVDSSTYSRDVADLPAGHNFAANADRDVGTGLGVADTEAVMQQGTHSNEAQRTLNHDDVATLLYAMSGLDESATGVDDYTIKLVYQGITSTNCDITLQFDNSETGFAQCSTGGHFIGTNHVAITSANIYFNDTANWFFNTSVAPPTTPSTPSATDGSYADKVRVSWSSVSGATSYKVFRCTTTSTSSCGSGYTANSSPYDVTNVTPETTYYFRIKACNSGGCSAYSDHDSGYASAIDLVTQNPAASKTSLTPGESFTFSATVLNQGTGTSGASTLRYYRSTDATISTSDTEIGTDAVGALAAGGTSPENIELNAPTSDGTWWIGACVDAVPNESDTGNQCSSGVQITVTSPDLVTQNPSADKTSLTPGESFTFSATVLNQGTGTSGASTLRYYRSTDATISTSDTEIGTDAVGALAAGGTSPENIELNAPTSDGTWWIGACVDAVPNESDTGNQCSSGVQITVTSPDLVTQNPSADKTSLTPGESFTFSATVRNQGTGTSGASTLRYYRSTDATISTSDTEIGTDAVGTLAAGGTSPESISLNAPASDGTWWIGACVDAVANESNTANQCSTGVKITVVTPYYTVGGTLSGLASGNTVVLQNNGGDDLSLSANGSFTFSSALADGSSYSITVLTQPTSPNQVCTVSNGSGTLSGANVTNVSVVCTTVGYHIGGNVDGLFDGYELVLTNNGGDDLTITTNGSFTFTTPVSDGGSYSVAILTQPDHPKHHCAVTNGSGTVAGGDVTDVSVTCVVDQLFTDVAPDQWAYDYIQTLAMSGITGGCGGDNYCPGDPVSRAQMAIFLERGIQGSSFVPPPATGTMFDDVSDSYWAAAWIEQLASDGITGGCGVGNNYCPDSIVTRDQMAVFLLRSKYGSAYVPPAATGTMFDDVSVNHWAVDWIEQLAVEGVTGGCDASNYCPDAEVSRDQMAVFLVRIFGL